MVGKDIRQFRRDNVAALIYQAYAEYGIAKVDSLVRLPNKRNEKRLPGETLSRTLVSLA